MLLAQQTLPAYVAVRDSAAAAAAGVGAALAARASPGAGKGSSGRQPRPVQNSLTWSQPPGVPYLQWVSGPFASRPHLPGIAGRAAGGSSARAKGQLGEGGEIAVAGIGASLPELLGKEAAEGLFFSLPARRREEQAGKKLKGATAVCAPWSSVVMLSR